MAKTANSYDENLSLLNIQEMEQHLILGSGVFLFWTGFENELNQTQNNFIK